MAEDDLLRRIAALEEVNAIRTLKAAYFAACDAKDPQAMRACFADGPVAIDYGPVGCFDNADAVVEVFRQIGCHPHMVELHHGANPRIEMIDESHARGSWALHYQLINTSENQLTQLAGYYEDEYCKDATGWKITATRINVMSTLVLHLDANAVKTIFAGRQPPVA